MKTKQEILDALVQIVGGLGWGMAYNTDDDGYIKYMIIGPAKEVNKVVDDIEDMKTHWN